MRYVLDTHVWIWWHNRPSALSKRVFELIESGKYDELLLSVISIWEFSKLLEKKRLVLAIDGQSWIDQALLMPRLKLAELSPEICYQSTRLPQPFHDDPADQLIVATARSHDAILLSSDSLIRRYSHVKSLW